MKCHIALSLVAKSLRITSNLVYMFALNVANSYFPACQSLSTRLLGQPSQRRSTRTVSPNSQKHGGRLRSVVGSVAMDWAMSSCTTGPQKGGHASEYSAAPSRSSLKKR